MGRETGKNIRFPICREVKREKIINFPAKSSGKILFLFPFPAGNGIPVGLWFHAMQGYIQAIGPRPGAWGRSYGGLCDVMWCGAVSVEGCVLCGDLTDSHNLFRRHLSTPDRAPNKSYKPKKSHSPAKMYETHCVCNCTLLSSNICL